MPKVGKKSAQAVNLHSKLDRIHETWKPKIVAELNDAYVKLVKVKGEFVWHHHEREDELFLVLKGRLRIELRDGPLDLREGELAVIPRGVEYRRVAAEEARVLLLEPETAGNTAQLRG